MKKVADIVSGALLGGMFGGFFGVCAGIFVAPIPFWFGAGDYSVPAFVATIIVGVVLGAVIGIPYFQPAKDTSPSYC